MTASDQEQPGRRRAVLRVLRASQVPMSIVAIAQQLDVHPNTVRFHLESLIGDGQVERVQPHRRGPGRPPLMFRAVPQMDRGGTRHYQLLAEILASGLAAEPDPAAKAIATGRAWGERLEFQGPVSGVDESIDRLASVLDGLGFEPEPRASGGGRQLGLRHCPFLEMAEKQPGVVCPIHLGLMRGALEKWDAPVTVDRLEAFVEPGLCLAHLAPVAAAP
ncbi:helix-turn-helix transcriptional regulator [Mycobacterium asiaticum]|uniref:helix-turn-helix transcriptional regulator n=1 Tax=Mycobacterium asiaticum TaxID=1790 RepID=UPI000567F09A|nr:helix-turn-helix domain-containing protein [Mycobacterium asiaticum]ORA10134.1 transcriptional regulator [Mycobacterium asiaticum DSM 44297]